MTADLSQWRTFVAVAEQGSISKAASTMRIDQPALSRSLRRLERDIGGALFQRGASGVQLTELGSALLPEAVELVAAADALAARAAEVVRSSTSRVRVGTLEYHPFSAALASTQRKLATEHPPVVLELAHLPRLGHAQALRTREIDLGFSLMMPEDLDADDFFAYQVIREERRLYAILPADHPLSGEDSLAPALLSGTPLILPDPKDNAGAYEQILSALTDAGYEAGAPVRVNRSLTDALQDVALGAGWTVAAGGVARNPMPGTVAVPLPSGILAGVHLVALWRAASEDRTVRSVVHTFRAELQSRRDERS
ncbi:LysR family transcriptional regulator [Leifsonia sp. AG29]|uniref:LysR family transcriptional regulator n=1 Tax=Leifsonia sp. AG29 TaxID=2598860 RepID=UPI00131E936C|nr:LysR family transcriptional regulator [Leifsonia sp. AG29]